MKDDFFQTLKIEDIEAVIKSLEIELYGNSFDVLPILSKDRRKFLHDKVKRYKDELMDRILMGVEE